MYSKKAPVVSGLFQLSCGSTDFLPYTMDVEKRCVMVDVPGGLGLSESMKSTDKPVMVYTRLKRIIKEVEVSCRTHVKEKFMSDLRKARELYRGQDLAKVSISFHYYS